MLRLDLSECLPACLCVFGVGPADTFGTHVIFHTSLRRKFFASWSNHRRGQNTVHRHGQDASRETTEAKRHANIRRGAVSNCFAYARLHVSNFGALLNIYYYIALEHGATHGLLRDTRRVHVR